jgi:DNA-binding transcriptional LysR family regulator
MTLHQLRIFSSIAKCLNVTKASAELHISQPSVSQQVKLLQEEYGVTLYRKNSRGVQLTDEGLLFLKEIEPILVQFDHLQKKGRDRRKESSFTIGGSRSPSAAFLPLIASLFKEAHPDIEITLRTDNSAALERMVLASEVEIGVISDPSSSPLLAYEPCREEELIFCLSYDHPMAKRKSLTLAELANTPLIVFKKGGLRSYKRILNEIESRGLNATVAMYCESSDALKAAAKTGMGIGIIYRDLALPEMNRKELKTIQVEGLAVRSQSHVIYAKNKPLSANANAFLTLLRQKIAPNRQASGSALAKHTPSRPSIGFSQPGRTMMKCAPSDGRLK